VAGAVATAYFVKAVNLRLFFGGEPVAPAEREKLLRTWSRVNVFHLAVLGVAWLAARRAANIEVCFNPLHRATPLVTHW
jgi:hypothetical protein